MWTLSGVRIYVEKDSGWQTAPRLGEINVLDSRQTILHCAGRPSYTRTLECVMFSGYHNLLLPLAQCSGLAATSGLPLLSDQGDEGGVIIKSLKADRLRDISRDTAVFRITLDLTKCGE